MNFRILIVLCSLSVSCASPSHRPGSGSKPIDPLTGEHVRIVANTPPRGAPLVDWLLRSGDVLLSKSPLCDGANEAATLREKVALTLGYALGEAEREVVISATCEGSKFETASEVVEDVWDCTLGTNERDEAGQSISASRLMFALAKDDWSLIDSSLRCF